MKKRYKNFNNRLKDQELTYNDLAGRLRSTFYENVLLFETNNGQQFVIKDLSKIYLNGIKITDILFKNRDVDHTYQKYIGYLNLENGEHFELQNEHNSRYIYWPSIGNLYFD